MTPAEHSCVPANHRGGKPIGVAVRKRHCSSAEWAPPPRRGFFLLGRKSTASSIHRGHLQSQFTPCSPWGLAQKASRKPGWPAWPRPGGRGCGGDIRPGLAMKPPEGGGIESCLRSAAEGGLCPLLPFRNSPSTRQGPVRGLINMRGNVDFNWRALFPRGRVPKSKEAKILMLAQPRHQRCQTAKQPVSPFGPC